MNLNFSPVVVHRRRRRRGKGRADGKVGNNRVAVAFAYGANIPERLFFIPRDQLPASIPASPERQAGPDRSRGPRRKTSYEVDGLANGGGSASEPKFSVKASCEREGPLRLGAKLRRVVRPSPLNVIVPTSQVAS